MIHILITGLNSYIGNQFVDWINVYTEEYKVSRISVKDQNWKAMDWSKYDTVLHVAGIAHNSSDKNLEQLYYQVNRDLTTEIAKKAKDEGVQHFVNMSSIIIYGSKVKKIESNTQPNPDNFYGDSKLQAEKNLNKLADDNFVVTHVRPPMVYGAGSKGNFPKLAKLANKTPFFPNYDNKRSMIYIKNLCEFLRLVIEEKVEGALHPQNREYVETSKLVRIIGEIQNKKVFETRIFNPIIKLFSSINLVNKVFGDLYYSKDLSNMNFEYQLYSLSASIEDSYNI